MRFITAIDTETANVDGGICEIAFVAIDTEKMMIVGYDHSLINPQVEMDAVCRAAHHIHPDEVRDAPLLKDWMGDNFVSGGTIAAHNAEFDRGHMGDLTPSDRFDWICTYAVAQHLYPEAQRFGNQVLRYHLDLDVSDMPEEAGGIVHRALYDTWCTAKMILRMLEDCKSFALEGESAGETLLRLTTAPVLQTKFTFGNKHRGKTWEEVAKGDQSYLRFMRDKCTDLDANTKHTLQHWLNKLARGEV